MTTTTDTSRDPAPRAANSRAYPRTDSRFERLPALAGFAFVALTVASTFLPGAPPASDASAAKIATYFRDNAGAIKAATFLGGLGIVALLWWFGSLWRVLHRAEGEPSGLAITAAISLAAGLALAMVSGVFTATAAIRIDSIGESSQLLFTLSLVAIAGAGFAIAAFLGAVCVLSHRTRLLPSWTDYVGGLAAVAFLVGGLGVATDANVVNVFAIVAFFVWCVWIIAVSVVIWRRAANTIAV
jgi:hypothetical protein